MDGDRTHHFHLGSYKSIAQNYEKTTGCLKKINPSLQLILHALSRLHFANARVVSLVPLTVCRGQGNELILAFLFRFDGDIEAAPSAFN